MRLENVDFELIVDNVKVRKDKIVKAELLVCLMNFGYVKNDADFGEIFDVLNFLLTTDIVDHHPKPWLVKVMDWYLCHFCFYRRWRGGVWKKWWIDSPVASSIWFHNELGQPGLARGTPFIEIYGISCEALDELEKYYL